MKSSPFLIINASAGSGKTYSLVYAYLKRLLSSNQDDAYRKMLALTFTNKAVHEMKSRILKSLYLLAYNNGTDDIKDYRTRLILDLKTDENFVEQKSKRVLKKILHEYAAFEVITLDSFTHKIIRTFAKDLKIPASFEVTLDVDQLLEETTESIIEKAGIDKKLTKILVDFSLSKTAELKSWNIGMDLFNFSKLLLNENDRIPISSLKKKKLNDFKTQKIKFGEQYEQYLEQLKLIGKTALKLITDKGLTKDDFTRKAVFNHFEKIANGSLERLYDNKLGENFEEGKNIYNRSLAEEKKTNIDAIILELYSFYLEAKSKVGKLLLLKNILNQWVPLSLIGEMESGLEALQLPYNRILLSRFNEIIDQEISALDAPYIYERLGEKYLHYFIDEFQDTSRLQWKNLIPLISNALESLHEAEQSGSLLLVGDPKQAIYRWRGGDNQQFLKLLNKESPFQIDPDITVLPKNYRSKKALVDFNNQFFAFVGSQIENTEQKKIFTEEAQQGFNLKEGGSVSIKFIEKTKRKEMVVPVYQSQTLAFLNEAKASDFAWSDMAVLVRIKDQAVLIATALQENNIPFISSESLSLDSSLRVNFLIALIRLVLYPEDYQERKNIVAFLCVENEKVKDYDALLNELIFDSFPVFQERLNLKFGLSFDFELFSKKSIYDAMEYAIANFDLVEKIDAHLCAFLDNIFEFKTNNNADFVTYLNYWENKGRQQCIVIPEGIDAVKIMTIHKAKGLEFPVVVIPFATEELSPLGNRKVWYPVADTFDSSFEWAWIIFSNKLKYLGLEGVDFYNRKIDEERMDALNTLYVALTRAASRMYLITQVEADKSPVDKSYATLLNRFVRNQGQEPNVDLIYEWGQYEKSEETSGQVVKHQIQSKFKIDSSWQNRLWTQMSFKHERHGDNALQKGILIHDLMGEVNHHEDVNSVIENALDQGRISPSESAYYNALLFEVVQHPDLKAYFDRELIVYNECDILVPKKSFVRPDRVVKTKTHWAIIDYKTGKYSAKHESQINRYAELINEMYHQDCKQFLVYINEEISVKPVV